MSKVKGVLDSFTGGKQAAKAATQAAGIQAASADKAIGLQREFRDIAREDLAPFQANWSRGIDRVIWSSNRSATTTIFCTR